MPLDLSAMPLKWVMVQDQKLLAQRLRDTELRNKFETLTAHRIIYLS